MKELNILLNGSRVLVRRIEMPSKTDSGLVLPRQYMDDKHEVGTVRDLDPYQKRGVIERIGVDCSESFREHFKEGDIVHFGPHGYEPVPLVKDKVDENSPYVLVEQYQIHWKELGK
jgi:co-chaperonin GroES (HSP10)